MINKIINNTATEEEIKKYIKDSGDYTLTMYYLMQRASNFNDVFKKNLELELRKRKIIKLNEREV